MSKSALIDGLAKAIPERHKVDLENPEVFILVEVFKVSMIRERLARSLKLLSEYMWDECCEGLLSAPQVQRHGDRPCEERGSTGGR